ncbi:MAG: flagellar protein FlaG [Deltaproteobacteria bacterium]|nr:flagellar protein FlaG [Candidatus Anaeroferrophillus wilburensis]MBN2888357.1 flagellar protein FlaG [Deltaproteobacteria bacterium]
MEVAMLQTHKATAEMVVPIASRAADVPVISRPNFAKPAEQTENKALLSAAELKEQVKETTDSLNEMSTLLKYGIRFGFDDQASEMLVNVIEVQTDRVIRQIPSKEILAMRAKMAEMVGLLVDQEV